MSVRTRNWLKFGSLVGLAFLLGLLFAGALQLPGASEAQSQTGLLPQQAPTRQASAVSPARQPSAVSNPGADMLIAMSDAFANVAEGVKPGVVFIKSQKTNTTPQRQLPPGMEQFFPHNRQGPRVEQGGGTGFVVSADGLILTNNHVVEGADKVTVMLPDHREFTASVVGTDPSTDVAVVRIPAKDLKPVVLGNSDEARVGEWVLAIGNPLGDALTFTVTSGIISATGRGLNSLPNRTVRSIQDFIQTDAAINPGNSGGPLVNVRGEVIGINSAIASETGLNAGYGFAIPINLARIVMDQLVATGRVERAALGINIKDAGPNDATYAGLPEIRGVLVQGFAMNSPAEKAGLRQGDIIISVNGKPVSYTAQLQQAIGFNRPGQVVQVEVARRGGVRKTYAVKLVALDAPELAQADAGPPDDSDAGPNGTPMTALGIAVEPLKPADALELGLPRGTGGLVVVDVTPDGPSWDVLLPADAGGPPDIILSVEGTPVSTEADLRSALKQPGPGGIVSLEVYRPLRGGGQRRVERIKVSGE
ncbi:MAG TPA: trypsin-like peptidase domain-containing protein [Gemmatimonadales bacterium]|jgi:serine protease Do|nr:trypsin-like peptidase domain-containing protein [Gemmatimonadales bacterium]